MIIVAGCLGVSHFCVSRVLLKSNSYLDRSLYANLSLLAPGSTSHRFRMHSFGIFCITVIFASIANVPVPKRRTRCKSSHALGCFDRADADWYNKNARQEAIAFRMNDTDFFWLSKELLQPGPKRIDLVHFTGDGEFRLRDSEWVFCDCDRSSPCFSSSRCDALARHERLPLILESLLMPDVEGSRETVRFMGTNEPFMVEAIVSIFRATCGPRAHFVDSGMNEGMWTLLGAAFGCNVIGIEPQPQCIRSASLALRINNLSAHVVKALLAPADLTVQVDTKKRCHAGWQSPQLSSPHVESRQMSIHSMRLDSLPQLKHGSSRVELWHLDVEGAEIPVLRSAAKLFAHHKIKRVIMEIGHNRWARYGIPSIHDGYNELRVIFNGWTCTWACNGQTFPWAPVAFRQVHCVHPWNVNLDLGWGVFDIFCVAPGVEAFWSANRTR